MKPKRRKKKMWQRLGTWMLVVSILYGSGFARAADIGLSTRFSDVILENLGPGASYNLTGIKNLPLTIVNGSTEEKEIVVAVEAPTKDELQAGYEPIPDPTWVKVLPDRFKLAAGARNLSDIVISVPDDPRLIGRHFQVMFWAHTLETGFLGVGIRVRVRFSIGARSPEAAKADIQRKKMLDLNFRLEPVTVSAGEVPVGKLLDLKKERNVSLKLVNTGAHQLKLSVESAVYRSPQKPPEGYEEIPDAKWLEAEPKVLTAEEDTITPIKLRLKVPDRSEYKGRKFAGLIWVNMVGEEIPLNVYSQVLFTTTK